MKLEPLNLVHFFSKSLVFIVPPSQSPRTSALNIACILNVHHAAKVCFFKYTGILLTHCILVDSSTVICWMGPFIILGVSGLFCCFYSIFDGKSC